MKPMKRIHTFHRGTNSWPQPTNHLDGRRCPTCKATVHGPEAQEDHHQHHLDEAEYRERVNEWVVYVAKMGQQVAELYRVLGVPMEDIGEGPGGDSGQWERGTMIEGGQYIPSGDPV